MEDPVRILAIEDDDSLRKLIEHMLRKQFAVTATSDGISALAWMSEGNIPDLILADIDMPKLNGPQFLESLKMSGFYRDIPVVILTGRSDEEIARKLIERGASGMLMKPFSRNELFEIVYSLTTEGY